MDSLRLRSKTNLGKQIKQVSPLLPVIDEPKELTVTMASKEDITGILKYHKTKKAFEPQYLGCETTDNAK